LAWWFNKYGSVFFVKKFVRAELKIGTPMYLCTSYVSESHLWIRVPCVIGVEYMLLVSVFFCCIFDDDRMSLSFKLKERHINSASAVNHHEY
jgi:hypothetical protein